MSSQVASGRSTTRERTYAWQDPADGLGRLPVTAGADLLRAMERGGVVAAMLDTVAGCAVHSTLDAGSGYTSLDLHTRFLRPVTPATGRVRAEGTVVSRGSRTATAEARLVDDRGRLLATATSTCLVFPIA